jgi:hypothetical protein
MGGDAMTTEATVTSYTDADYAADKSARKSVSGELLLVQGMPVGWHVKQQSAVVLSTADEEFVVAVTGAKELLGLRNLLEEIGVRVALPMRMLIDNQASRKRGDVQRVEARGRQAQVHQGRQQEGRREAGIRRDAEDAADVFTKGQPAQRLAELCKDIGVI